MFPSLCLVVIQNEGVSTCIIKNVLISVLLLYVILFLSSYFLITNAELDWTEPGSFHSLGNHNMVHNSLNFIRGYGKSQGHLQVCDRIRLIHLLT